jgi:hypothetical protein
VESASTLNERVKVPATAPFTRAQAMPKDRISPVPHTAPPYHDRDDHDGAGVTAPRVVVAGGHSAGHIEPTMNFADALATGLTDDLY